MWTSCGWCPNTSTVAECVEEVGRVWSSCPLHSTASHVTLLAFSRPAVHAEARGSWWPRRLPFGTFRSYPRLSLRLRFVCSSRICQIHPCSIFLPVDVLQILLYTSDINATTARLSATYSAWPGGTSSTPHFHGTTNTRFRLPDESCATIVPSKAETLYRFKTGISIMRLL